jgi:hypothetical protein
MKQELTDKEAKQPIIVYRMAYGMFLLLVIYYLIRGDVENATINMGIALIFDPFDANIKWQDRPLYQRAWSLLHLFLAFTGLFYMLLR